MRNVNWKSEIGRKRTYNSVFAKELGVQNVVHWEVLNISKNQEMSVEFINTNSKYRQGGHSFTNGFVWNVG